MPSHKLIIELLYIGWDWMVWARGSETGRERRDETGHMGQKLYAICKTMTLGIKICPKAPL